ncbi:MAG: riboflavin synthase [bacterium]|jgi:riboflavin synthase|nr:riboflavin synthase [bacterium]
MFTGIVRALGRVTEARAGHLGIEAQALAAQFALGDSVAVNGVCLTVVGSEGATFFADVVPETLRRSNLGRLAAGDPVNLEPSLRIDQGLDGHLVQGHVDAMSEVEEVQHVDLGREVRIALPDELAPLLAEKGSITVDGTSLTVAAVEPAAFTVALIPHTLEVTLAGGYRPGTLVNLEVDVVARYVQRLLATGGFRP